ncbi:MAG: flagellar basal-body rod protein FlgB [Myxococcota bacterium]|jgi:flagellar basal-body rod protein FlgB
MALRFDSATVQLGRSLDLRLKRQELITSNLVNSDTPHYQPKDLEFEGYLQSAQALEAGADKLPVDRVVDRGNATDTLDGNAVNKDEEIGKASENMLRYTTTLELMQRKMAILRYAITGQ